MSDAAYESKKFSYLASSKKQPKNFNRSHRFNCNEQDAFWKGANSNSQDLTFSSHRRIREEISFFSKCEKKKNRHKCKQLEQKKNKQMLEYFSKLAKIAQNFVSSKLTKV